MNKQASTDDLESVCKFLFEIGSLKNTPRSGWFKVGVENPESVAEHSFRTAIIGFVLACLEGIEPKKVSTYCLFHDLPEARTSDLDWLAQKYLTEKENQQGESVLKDQLQYLPDKITDQFTESLCTNKTMSDEVKEVSRDADLLETVLQAIEYERSGHAEARGWASSSIELLSTETGTRIGRYLRDKMAEGSTGELHRWWESDT